MNLMLRICRGGCWFFVLVGCFLLTGFTSNGEASSAESEVVFGGVKVRMLTRTVVFSARVNAVEGSIEYGIVTPAGPTHESLLVTEISPVNLHAAMLLLGIRGGAMISPSNTPAAPDAISNHSKVRIPIHNCTYSIPTPIRINKTADISLDRVET